MIDPQVYISENNQKLVIHEGIGKFNQNDMKCIKKSNFEDAQNFPLHPQIPYEYISDIYENLIIEENEMDSMYGYFKFQNDINEKMRAILVDWIIEVHFKFKLTSDTLFLCVYLIDKYLSLIKIQREKLQLVGVTALMISCKYEEIFSPELRDFIYVTDKAYSAEDILILEVEMLKMFKFDITKPCQLKFFEIISQNLNFNDIDKNLGQYLLELFLIDYRYLKYKPSIIACSVGYLVMKVNKYENFYCIYDYLKYEKSLLKECAKDICFLLDNLDNTKMISVKRKYLSNTFHQVARVKIY